MTKRKPLIFDEYMPWPYVESYGWVKQPRKKREPKASRTQPTVIEPRVPSWLETGAEAFAATFAAAARNPEK